MTLLCKQDIYFLLEAAHLFKSLHQTLNCVFTRSQSYFLRARSFHNGSIYFGISVKIEMKLVSFQ